MLLSPTNFGFLQTVRVEISALFDFLHCNILGQGKSNKTPEPNFNHRLIEVCK